MMQEKALNEIGLVEGLISLRQHVSYPLVRDFLRDRLEGARTELETTPDMNKILFVRGQCAVYRSLLDLIERDIDLIKQAQEIDRQNAPEKSDKA